MASRVAAGLTRPQRVLLVTAFAAAAVWAALIAVFGGLHFDDYVNIAESAGALAPSAWGGLAADGRWQPMKRATYDLLARAAGLHFWPYAMALMIAHAAMAMGVAACARAIWRDRGTQMVAGALALASLNLSAFSVAYAATLHGIASAALSAWCVALSLGSEKRGQTPFFRRAPLGWRALAAAAVLIACLYKETAVTTPALALFAAWLLSREEKARMNLRSVARVLAPSIAGVLAYLALRAVVDAPLVPPQGRYSGGGTLRPALNTAVVLAHVLPWALAGAAGALTALGGQWRQTLLNLTVAAAAAIGAVLPTLVLSWQSPNFFYAAAPVAALAAVAAARTSPSPRVAYGALTALVVITLTGSAAFAAMRGVHRWGPYAESSVAEWLTLPRSGGRVIWFDQDNGKRYGGLARTIGPGERLSLALRLASGDATLEAVACIPVLVGPPCVAQPGDDLYLHSGGRVQRIEAPPAGSWYVMP